MVDDSIPQNVSMEDLADLLIDGARHDEAEDVQTALDLKVDVNSTDYNGRTALHMASGNGHATIAQSLIDAGADVGAKNEEGNTPLHFACLNGHVDIVKMLMLHGASPSELNRHSRTPVDEALGRPFQDSVVDVVNSFFKQPLVEVDQMQQDGDVGEDEREEDHPEELEDMH